MGRAEKERESFVWYKCKGSGQEAALKQIKGMKKSIIRNNRSAEVFNMCVNREIRLVQIAAAKLDLLNLLKCQIICHHLDLEQDIQEPFEKFFWPKQVSEVGTNEPVQEEEGVLSIHEQLEILSTYLRQTYYYCLYCAKGYDNETDLMEKCPGRNRQDH